MKYSILLFDADNTVLDFDRSEEQALQKAFIQHNLDYNHSVLTLYRKNNIAQWQLYEKGVISRDEVLINRFTETFRQLGVVCDVQSVADVYEENLHHGYFTVEHAQEVLEELQKTCRLYIVSNGVLSIQNSRMAGSGLGKYFVSRFISEEIGYPKPQIEFFNTSFARIEHFNRKQALIIGDSLSSDIQGGVNAGIDTCWFNPHGASNNSKLTPTYEISDLRQLLDIVLN